MSKDCANPSLGNTGLPDCFNVADTAKDLLLDMRFDSTGAVKERLLSDMSDFTSLETFLNADDPQDRIYPILGFENVENLREDSVFFEYASGKQNFVRDGFKNFVGMIPNPPYGLVAKIKENRCFDAGAWIHDDSGQLIYYKTDDPLKGRPILIDKDTWDAKYIEATDTDPPMIAVAFQWKKTQLDENLGVVPSDQINWDQDDLYGLIDVDATYTDITTAGFTAQINDVCYDRAGISGLQLADFTAEEISPTPAPEPIASVTESPTVPGQYGIVWDTATTSGDVHRLSLTKDGLDASAMSDGTNDITTP